MKGKQIKIFFLITGILLIPIRLNSQNEGIFKNVSLQVTANGHYLEFANGKPFFWLGDTGWLLFSKLNREEAEEYIKDRSRKGFNVIQAVVIHDIPEVNIYGDSAFIEDDPARPKVTSGNEPSDSDQYDFWDHIDYIVNLAAANGIYIAMVPVWGANVRNNKVNMKNAAIYAAWIAERYKDKPNIIWINGGDTRGNQNTDVWNEIGNTIRRIDPNHLITFHPFGRTQSSTWFNDEPWLSFNMFQSGHKDYTQDSAGYGEDNWKYVLKDFNTKPVKPTLDGEPSYENIPHGLHDSSMPYWNDDDVRRYAYWSVFAGACGFTYGDNAVMQMHKPHDGKGAYGVKEYWYQALNDPGSTQMNYLKKLILSVPYFERLPEQKAVAGFNGKRYNYIAVTGGKKYMFAYTYNGRTFKLRLGKIAGNYVNVYWYNPRNGNSTFVEKIKNKGVIGFNPPCVKENGNDWVLVLKSAD